MRRLLNDYYFDEKPIFQELLGGSLTIQLICKRIVSFKGRRFSSPKKQNFESFIARHCAGFFQLLMHTKKGKFAFLGKFATSFHRFMVVFICLQIISLIHFNRLSVALLKLENALDLQVRRGQKMQNEYTLDSLNLSYMSSVPNQFISKMSKQLKQGEKSFLGSFVNDLLKTSNVAPGLPDRLPPVHGSPVAGSDKQIHRKWQKKKWSFELSIANTIVLEQVAPEDAISYGRHYTESVRNRSRPLRPGTAAVSDASFLAALSPADFASIKRIWIWGGTPTSLPVA